MQDLMGGEATHTLVIEYPNGNRQHVCIAVDCDARAVLAANEVMKTAPAGTVVEVRRHAPATVH